MMKLRKWTFLGMFIALSFVLSTVIVFSNMAPAQHMMNVIGAVMLGPGYNALAAFLSGGLRMMLSGRPLVATSGWIGAFLSGLVYRKTHCLWLTVVTEMIGSGMIAAVLYYYPMTAFVGADLPSPLFYIPFFLPSAIVGAIIGGIVQHLLRKHQIINQKITHN